jgi:hypothetical protein
VARYRPLRTPWIASGNANSKPSGQCSVEAARRKPSSFA